MGVTSPAPHTRRDELDGLSDLPSGTAELLAELARPPGPLPPLVDARIRAAIDAHAFTPATTRGRGAWLARWATAAALAMACGGALGWASAGWSSSMGGSRVRSLSDMDARDEGRITIVDAMVAARLARDGGPVDATRLARLDANGDGDITVDDVGRLARRAVAIGEGGS